MTQGGGGGGGGGGGVTRVGRKGGQVNITSHLGEEHRRQERSLVSLKKKWRERVSLGLGRERRANQSVEPQPIIHKRKIAKEKKKRRRRKNEGAIRVFMGLRERGANALG